MITKIPIELDPSEKRIAACSTNAKQLSVFAQHLKILALCFAGPGFGEAWLVNSHKTGLSGRNMERNHGKLFKSEKAMQNSLDMSEAIDVPFVLAVRF